MSDFEIGIWGIIGFFLFVKIGLPIIFPPEPEKEKEQWNSEEIEKQINSNSKFYNMINKENWYIKKLSIKIQKIENKIERLEIETSTDFENEASNNNKIEDFKLDIQNITVDINNRYDNIDELNRKIKWMY